MTFPELRSRKECLDEDWFVYIGMKNSKNVLYERKRFTKLKKYGVFYSSFAGFHNGEASNAKNQPDSVIIFEINPVKAIKANDAE